jgi:23S rRNA (adenine2503-C2)-methyltransferase
MGLIRQLSVGEIIGHLMLAHAWLTEHPEWLENVRLAPHTRISNIVFMGMGEPLDNVEAVIDALSIMTDPYGLALGYAHISVSTAGHLDGIRRLYAAHPKARLALSVHSPDDKSRSRIMPINRRWPLATILAELRAMHDERQLMAAASPASSVASSDLMVKNGLPPIMLQYTLIAGVNDSTQDAKALLALTEGLPVKVNLIPLNNVGPSRLTAPSPDRIQEFRDVLHQGGLRVMVRYSKGQDIAAACGQLVALTN